jgi:hypothetical protein
MSSGKMRRGNFSSSRATAIREREASDGVLLMVLVEVDFSGYTHEYIMKYVMAVSVPGKELAAQVLKRTRRSFR